MIEKYKAVVMHDDASSKIELRYINQLKKLMRHRLMSIRLNLMRIDIDNLQKIYRGLLGNPSPIVDLDNIKDIKRAERIIHLREVLSILKEETYWLISEIGEPSEKCRISPGMLNKRNLFLNRIKLKKLKGLPYLHLTMAGVGLDSYYNDKLPPYIVDCGYNPIIDGFPEEEMDQ